MATGLVWDERYAWHESGSLPAGPFAEPYPCPDTPATKRRIYALLEVSGLTGHLARLPARPATEQELLRFHTPDHIARVAELSAAGGGSAGENAWVGPGSYEIACLAAGGCLTAVDAVLAGEVDNAYALVRPAGHHAIAAAGRGFCLFGNTALADLHAGYGHGLQRVAVVDWDVHHGNGTQDAFYGDRQVLTISIHQDRNYPPDSGDLDELGEGVGEGYNLNVPLPPGSGHGAYLATVERVVLPALHAFRPELILVASGVDAAVRDPLGRMLCTSETYRAMTTMMVAAAAELCGGRLVACHEGGYAPTYAPFCGLATIEALSGLRTEVADPHLARFAHLPGQDLQPHQGAVIDQAAARISLIR